MARAQRERTVAHRFAQGEETCHEANQEKQSAPVGHLAHLTGLLPLLAINVRIGKVVMHVLDLIAGILIVLDR